MRLILQKPKHRGMDRKDSTRFAHHGCRLQGTVLRRWCQLVHKAACEMGPSFGAILLSAVHAFFLRVSL